MKISRRKTLVLGSALALAASPFSLVPNVFELKVSDWAEIAARHLMSMGVMPVANSDDNGNGTALAKGLSQRRVDWFDPLRNGVTEKIDRRSIDVRLYALMDNVVRSIYPSTELKTFSLKIPQKDQFSAESLSFGHLRLRFLQSYQPFYDEGGMLLDEGILSRVDILFPSVDQG